MRETTDMNDLPIQMKWTTKNDFQSDNGWVVVIGALKSFLSYQHNNIIVKWIKFLVTFVIEQLFPLESTQLNTVLWVFGFNENESIDFQVARQVHIYVQDT